MSVFKSLKKISKEIRRYNDAQVEGKKVEPHELHGNRSEKWSVGINALLAAFTLIAIYFTYEANSTAKRANESAERSARFNDSISRENLRLAQIMFAEQIESSEAKDSIDSINLNISQRGLEAQIKSINDANDRFIRENRPYLQIGAFYFTSFKVGEKIEFKYDVFNLGNQPVIVLDRRVNVNIMTVINRKIYIDRNVFQGSSKEEKIMGYIGKEPLMLKFYSDTIMDADTFQGLMEDKLGFYFFGELKYQNLITKKIGRNKFCIFVSIKASLNTTSSNSAFIYNENIE